MELVVDCGKSCYPGWRRRSNIIFVLSITILLLSYLSHSLLPEWILKLIIISVIIVIIAVLGKRKGLNVQSQG